VNILINIGIVAALIAAVVGILFLLVGLYYRTARRFRKHFSLILKKSSKLTNKDILRERPYKDFYFRRPELDDLISTGIIEGRNVLILGPPLSGKSRAALEALSKLQRPCSVIIPRHDNIDREDFSFPRQICFWRKGITFIDDLQRFVEQQNFDCLIEEARRRKNILVVTCRSGNEWENAKYAMADKDLHIETIFENRIVELKDRLSGDQGRDIAESAGIDWTSVRFDGTIGSIFMPLLEIEERYKECDESEQTILFVLKELYLCGIYRGSQSFPLEWVKTAAARHGLQGSILAWKRWLDSLKGKDLLSLKNNNIVVEEVYLEYIVNPAVKTDITFFTEILSVFLSVPEALIKLAKKVYTLGIIHLEKSSHMKICIKACEEALKVHTLERFPMQYGITQNNLGTAYRALGEVEDKANNCRKAIEAYEEALKVYKENTFPEIYFLIKSNIDIAIDFCKGNSLT
jgi:hypothetical protein